MAPWEGCELRPVDLDLQVWIFVEGGLNTGKLLSAVLQ